MHDNNLKLFTEYGLPHIKKGDNVLEVGPEGPMIGRGVGFHLMMNQGVGYYNFCDIKNVNQGLLGFVPMTDEYNIGVENDTFDVVFSLSVAEHVRKLWTWAKELRRVTKPGGVIIFVNPVSWPYHPSPYDCWRILPDGYKALFEECGLDHTFSFHGNLLPLEPLWLPEHGPGLVTDTIAIGRKPHACT